MSAAVVYALLAIAVAILRQSAQQVSIRTTFGVVVCFWMLMAILALH